MVANAWDELLMDNKFLAASGAAMAQIARKPRDLHVRPWPPVMIRDFLRTHESDLMDVLPNCRVGSIVDFLAAAPTAVVTVTDVRGNLLGTIVDDDIMGAIVEHGVQALDWPVTEVIQAQRPTCSSSDSPYVVLHDMMTSSYDRFVVRERGLVVGVVMRRDLANFVNI